jgi:hypothetical protein
MRVRLVAAVLGLALALPVAAAAADREKTLKFTSVVRTSAQSKYNFPDVGHYYSGVTTGSGFEQASFLTPAQAAKLEKIDLQTHFVITAELRSRTSGWSIAIRGIELRRINRSKREFCIYAKVTRPKPGEAIVCRQYENIEYVQLSSKPFQIDQFHWNIPKASVLLSTSGTVLYRSTEGTDQHNRPIVTGNAKACKR